MSIIIQRSVAPILTYHTYAFQSEIRFMLPIVYTHTGNGFCFISFVDTHDSFGEKKKIDNLVEVDADEYDVSGQEG